MVERSELSAFASLREKFFSDYAIMLIALRRLVADLFALFHERPEGLGMRFHVVGTNVDAEMAVLVTQSRIGIALLQVDQPALDAVSHDVVLRNRVAWAV